MTADAMRLFVARPDETPAQVLRRLERRSDFVRLIETDAGQALLREAAQRAQKARREVRA